MRLTRDSTWRRFGNVVLAGSPLRLFRVTDGGGAVLDRIETDEDVAESTLVDRLLDAGAVHPMIEPGGATVFGLNDVTVVTPHLGGRASTDGRLIIDDGSNPPIVGASLRLERNRGPAAARNAARPLVTTSLIAFVDADVDLLDQLGCGSWLTPLLAHFDDPQVGLVAPRVRGEPTSQLDLGDEPGRIRAGTRLSYVPAAAIVVRAEAFDGVGGFDEMLRLGEDVDLVWRLDDAGWSCRYEPASMVWHEPRASMRGRLRQHSGYGSSAAPLSIRHPRSLAPFRSNRWTAVTYLLALAGHPLAAIGVGIGSAAALVPKLPDLPPVTAVRLAATGHLAAAGQLASAVRRVWWPLVITAAIVSRRARLVAVGAMLFAPASTLTDMAYGVGVWRGVVRHRTIRPLLPDIHRSSNTR